MHSVGHVFVLIRHCFMVLWFMVHVLALFSAMEYLSMHVSAAAGGSMGLCWTVLVMYAAQLAVLADAVHPGSLYVHLLGRI